MNRRINRPPPGKSKKWPEIAAQVLPALPSTPMTLVVFQCLVTGAGVQASLAKDLLCWLEDNGKIVSRRTKDGYRFQVSP